MTTYTFHAILQFVSHQLPGRDIQALSQGTATWSLTKWTVDDYNAMLAKMADGSLVVDNDYSKLDSTDSLTLNLVK